MDNIIKKRRPEYAITEEEIKEVEERFEIVFPKVLRDFYLEHNGDLIKSCIFTLDGNNYMVAEMFYIKHPNAALELIMQWDRQDGFIPATMVPLAHDPGGERYYWNTEDESVYFIDGLDIENPVFVCKTIDEFFKLIEGADPF